MRRRICAAAVAATGALFATVTPAAAADGGKPARTVEWSTAHATAAATGERWTEPTSTWLSRDLVLSGKLSNTGEGCYSLWTQFTFDLVPTPARKQAEVCGPGAVDVNVRQAYKPTSTGQLAVCKGTKDVKDCGPGQNITSGPVNRD